MILEQLLQATEAYLILREEICMLQVLQIIHWQCLHAHICHCVSGVSRVPAFADPASNWGEILYDFCGKSSSIVL